MSGHRGLWGSTCGERRFGESWKKAEKRIEERAKRQYELKKLDRLALIIAPFREGLTEWLPAMDRVVQRRKGFERLGDLASQARLAANQHNGVLTVGRRVKASAAREAGMQTDEYVEVAVGTLAGAGLFDLFDPAKVVAGSLAAMEEMGKGLHGSDTISTTTLIKRRKAFERTFEELEHAARMHLAAQEFFTIENFKRLWSGPTITAPRKCGTNSTTRASLVQRTAERVSGSCRRSPRWPPGVDQGISPRGLKICCLYGGGQITRQGAHSFEIN
jgi:hypothetical protein